MAEYASVEQIVAERAGVVRPPMRMSVSAAAEEFHYVYKPGSYIGEWDNTFAPYLVEPMNEMTSLDFTGLIFVGPARCGKSVMVYNWLAHTALCDPADMMVIHMTQASARDWSNRELAMTLRHSPKIAATLIPGRQNDNVWDKRFKSGMQLLISWPVITQLSGKTIPRLWLMDYDRMPEDVDGEGNPYDLASKRATTFGRYGMTVAESSPGHDIDNPKWIASSPHQAPPTKGILALYNRGDRRRWYWKCLQCGEPFLPSFGLLDYDASTPDPIEAGEKATMVCPHCGYPHVHADKHQLNLTGKWVKDGQKWLKDGSLEGTPARSSIASFWLDGTCSAFMEWKAIVAKYIIATREYETTGSEDALRVTVNVDQGSAYLPIAMGEGRLPEQLKARAEDLGERVVPVGTRFLLALIDVQKSRFVVQVHGVGVGGDIYVVDRFDIKYSRRIDPDTDGQFLWVKPASYLEDWQLLIDEVMLKTYPLGDGSGRRMQIMFTGCDSGGYAEKGRDSKVGVTAKAYEFRKWLRDNDDHGLLNRFTLIKGDPKKEAPRARVGFPDAERKDRRAQARGEVPVLMLNSNLLKDQADAMLSRTEPGGGMVHFPKWLDDDFYVELTVEVKTPKGWENLKHRRNESWDLLYYCVGLCLSRYVRIDTVDWDDPPGWAAEWESNDLVIASGGNKRFDSSAEKKYSLEELAEMLGGPVGSG